MNHKKVADLFLSVIKNSSIVVSLALLMAACVDQEVHLPEGYLSQEKMVDIMVDIHLVEGARSGNLLLGDTNDLPDYYARIYEKYNVSEEEFKANFNWYTQHPTALKTVYEEVIVALSKLEEEIKVTTNTAD